MNRNQLVNTVFASLCLLALTVLTACSDSGHISQSDDGDTAISPLTVAVQSSSHQRSAPLVMQYRWLTPPMLEVPARLQMTFTLAPRQSLLLTPLPVPHVAVSGLPAEPLYAGSDGQVVVVLDVTALAAGRHYVKLMAAVGAVPLVSQRALVVPLTAEGAAEDNTPPAGATKMPASRF